jgi:hypothetical protein
MTKFTIDITDPDRLAGITGAREAHNANQAGVEGFEPLATDNDYVQHVMDYASASYAKQHALVKVFTDDAKLVGKTFMDETGKAVEVALAEPA